MASIRAKAMMYEQSFDHAPWKDLGELETKIKALKPKKWAFNVHDKDLKDSGDPALDHVHAMLVFDNARSINSVAKAFNDKPQQMTAWKGDSRNGFSYLCHRTANALSKHQYDPANVVANFDYVSELASYEVGAHAAKVTAKVPTFLDALYEGSITREEVMSQITGSQLGRYRRQIDDVVTARLLREADEWRSRMRAERRSIESIWLYGETETGKTAMAKDLLSKRFDRYFISGSTRGPFDRYDGQHGILIDEIGPDMIPYADLKRITDPNAMDTEISAPARYKDKTLMPELIVFTSPFSPYSVYRQQVDSNTDTFAQFERRIGLCLHMTQGEMIPMMFDPRLGYVPVPGGARPNPFSASARAAAAPAVTPKATTLLARFDALVDSLGPATSGSAGNDEEGNEDD